MYSFNFNPLLVDGGGGARRGGAQGGGLRIGRSQNRRKGNYGKKYKPNKKKNANQPVLPELIDPKKIFVFGLSVHIKEEGLENFMNKYGKVVDMRIVKRGGKSKNYAFITFESDESAERVLSLDTEELTIDGYGFGIKPGKRQFKIPGMPGFQRIQMSEREFDLEPPDPTKASMHMLIDDVLLRIMDFLPLRDLLRIDEVCRRWQSLVHTSFRSKIPTIMEGNINMWLNRNIINPTLPVISKVLILSGESLLSLSVSDRELYKGKLLKVIGQLCPSLETLSIDSLCNKSVPTLKELVLSCPHLKSFKCTQSINLTDRDLEFILVNLQNLETLHIDDAFISGLSLARLPDTLQVLELPRCKEIAIYLPEISARCPLLKVLQMDDVVCLRSFVNDLGRKCQYLTDLTIACNDEVPDFSTMTCLKKLCYKGLNYSINSLLLSLPAEFENLKLLGTIQETENDLVDFSVLKNLRVLYLPMQNWNSLSIQSVKTISYCSKLNNLRYKGSNNHKPAILDIIRRCQDLKDLECMGVTLSNEDLDSFAEANKRRVGLLKLTIGLDRSGMDIVEKLSEAKYDVNMVDVDNIFGDDQFSDEEDDDYDFYDGFMSGEDYDSDQNPYDAFDDEDFLYYENYGLVQPWEMIFGALDASPPPGAYDEYDCFGAEDEWS